MKATTRTAAQNVRRVIRSRIPICEEMVGWDGALRFVRTPTDRLADALLALDAEDTPEARENVRRKATAVVAAWRLAAEAWKAEGRPGGREEVPA